MIGYLSGTFRSGVVITGSGVGYRVSTPDVIGEGAEVALCVTTIVRENDISLYGFSEETDRLVFEALLRVSRVGPQMALAIVRDVGVGALAGAVSARDATVVTKAKGVGRKLAEVIVASVELPDGIEATATTSAPNEMVASLEELGFDGDAVRAALAEVLERHETSPDEADLIAEVLAILSERR